MFGTLHLCNTSTICVMPEESPLNYSFIQSEKNNEYVLIHITYTVKHNIKVTGHIFFISIN